MTVSGAITMTATASQIVPGATSWAVRNNADSANNIIITNAGAVTFRSTVGGITTLTATSVVAALTGNASTATALATARTIGGTSFDGTANIVPATITVADTTDATSFVGLWESATGDLAPKTDGGLTYNATTGTLTATAFSGPLTGNASTATALATARNINGVAFDGTGNITVTAAAGTLSGATLAAGVTASSLTSLGTLTDLATSGLVDIQIDGATVQQLRLSNFNGTIADRSQIEWWFENSIGTKEKWAYLEGIVTDVNDGSEDFGLRFFSMRAGTVAERFRVDSTVVKATVDQFAVESATAGGIFNVQDVAGTVTCDINFLTGSGVRITDGIQVGLPTGGDKGNGTINVATDIYKNNTVYTDPDAVFEKVFTGEVVRFNESPFADYPGLMPLREVEAYTKKNYQLPRVAWARGIFERTDVLLEKIEELHLYSFDHERRIIELETELAYLKAMRN